MLARVLLHAASGLAARIPLRLLLGIASLSAEIDFRASPARRSAVLANLAQIARAGDPSLSSGPKRRRCARAIFRSYHRSLAEFLARHRQGTIPTSAFRFEGVERLYRALDAGRGAVITAPHLGNWELAGLALARFGFRVHVVTGTQWNPLLHGALRALKERSGISVSTPRDGFLPLLATLRRGGLVVLLVDGDVWTRGASTRFFASAVPFPTGPALLARRAGAALLHAHATRAPEGHRVVFGGVDRPDPALPVRVDVARLTSRIAAAQERNIAAHVSEWCIFRRFFPDPGPGTAVVPARGARERTAKADAA